QSLLYYTNNSIHDDTSYCLLSHLYLSSFSYPSFLFFFFFFNDTATTEIYTLSLHDALPIRPATRATALFTPDATPACCGSTAVRSEEHTSELQSRGHLVCRLLLEKKKKTESRIGT